MERMTDPEFTEKAYELLKDLPAPIQSAISYWAYEQGHAYGNESILEHIQGLSEVIESFKSYLVTKVVIKQ